MRRLGGQPNGYGPFGLVRNSDAPFQETQVADNIFLLLAANGGGGGYKMVDFASDPAVKRVVEHNVASTSPEGLGLAGGAAFPAALVPTAKAGEIAGKASRRDIPRVAGMPVPPFDSSPDRGAFAVGADSWQAGCDAWPGRPKAQPVPVPVAAPGTPVVTVGPEAPVQPVAPTPAPGQPPAATSQTGMIIGAIIIAVLGLLVIVLLSRSEGRPRRRR